MEGSKSFKRENNFYSLNLKGDKLYALISKSVTTQSFPIHKSQVKLQKICTRKSGSRSLHSLG